MCDAVAGGKVVLLQTIILVTRQMLAMFAYMAVGGLLFHARVLTEDGAKTLANLLVKLVIPAVIVNSFCVAFTPERLAGLGAGLALSALLLAAAILPSRLLFPRNGVHEFAAEFSNAGFLGIPLVQGAVGAHAVFYIAGFVALLNLLQVTYGVRRINPKQAPLRLRTLAGIPIVWAFAIGLCLFWSGWGAALPPVIKTTLSGICTLNTPLAMMVLGCYFAKAKLFALFTTPSLYLVSFVRLLAIPALSLLLLWALPVSGEMRLALLLAAAAPVGANVAIYAQLQGGITPMPAIPLCCRRCCRLGRSQSLRCWEI